MLILRQQTQLNNYCLAFCRAPRLVPARLRLYQLSLILNDPTPILAISFGQIRFTFTFESNLVLRPVVGVVISCDPCVVRSESPSRLLKYHKFTRKRLAFLHVG